MDKCVFSCLEHVEELMDDLLEDVGQMPIIEVVKNKELCARCANHAIYQLIGSDVEITWE